MNRKEKEERVLLRRYARFKRKQRCKRRKYNEQVEAHRLQYLNLLEKQADLMTSLMKKVDEFAAA